MEINQLNILAVGSNAAIMQVIHRLINAHEKWTGTIAATVEEAINTANETPFEIVLLCAGINEAEAAQLKDRLTALHPAVIIIRHFGGGSGLLENEVLAALDFHQIKLI